MFFPLHLLHTNPYLTLGSPIFSCSKLIYYARGIISAKESKFTYVFHKNTFDFLRSTDAYKQRNELDKTILNRRNEKAIFIYISVFIWKRIEKK